MSKLKPFWRYYGGKNRAAKWYPSPEHQIIIEPFAGAAGYSCRYSDRNVILIDKNPIISSIWKYLIKVSVSEILKIPDIPNGGTVDDLKVCQEARWLIGFWLNSANVRPCKTSSKFAMIDKKKNVVGGWTQRTRDRIAKQVPFIRHWKVIEGDYTDAPNIDATWHIDPPYNNKAGSYYSFQPENFNDLGDWCQSRKGLVMVCENEGAEWLPFQSLRTTHNQRSTGSKEVIWLNRPPKHWIGVQTDLFSSGLLSTGDNT